MSIIICTAVVLVAAGVLLRMLAAVKFERARVRLLTILEDTSVFWYNSRVFTITSTSGELEKAVTKIVEHYRSSVSYMLKEDDDWLVNSSARSNGDGSYSITCFIVHAEKHVIKRLLRSNATRLVDYYTNTKAHVNVRQLAWSK